MPEVRRQGSGRSRGRLGREDRRELLASPFGLALVGEFSRERVAQLDQHLDVQCGVAQHFLPQRADRPVRRGMAFLQVEAEHLLDQCAEGDPRVAEQPPGQLGVEQLPRPEAHLGQAGQVLRCRMQDGFRVLQCGVHTGEHGAGDGIDKHRARAGAAELDQVGALSVAVSRGSFGIDRDGPVALR